MRALRVDLSTGQQHELSPPAAWRHLLLGGRGWTARLLSDLSPEIGPRDPENPLLFATGPLAGTAAVGAGGGWVAALSPITGLVTQGWAGGDWGAALRQSGYDLVIVTGQAATWSVLEIGSTTPLRDAAGLLGLDTIATDQALRGNDERVHTLVLGPAGEVGVAYATPVVDGAFLVEPAGVGAVMAQKRLKAVVIREGAVIAAADAAALQRVDAAYTQRSISDPLLGEWQRFGTALYVNRANDLGAVTARNGQDGVFKGMLALSRTTLALKGKQTGRGCGNHVVPCYATLTTKEGSGVARPELTVLLGFGARCGVADLDTVIAAGQRCVRWGLDPTAAAAAIAFLMECQQHGLHSQPPLPWGDGATLLDTLDKIATKKGIGGVLGLGVGEMREIFWGSADWAPQVRDGALPPLDPRPLPAFALHFATSTWGGDYRMAAPLAALLAQSPAAVPQTKGSVAEQAVAQVIWHERWAAALDAAGFCRRLGLLAYNVLPQELADMVSAVVGETFTVGALAKLGERVVTLERLLVARQGTPDTLPLRWRSTAVSAGRAAGHLPDLAGLLPLYYGAHGWDAQGVPGETRLRALDLLR